jgi:hypothetical protein
MTRTSDDHGEFQGGTRPICSSWRNVSIKVEILKLESADYFTFIPCVLCTQKSLLYLAAICNVRFNANQMTSSDSGPNGGSHRGNG